MDGFDNTTVTLRHITGPLQALNIMRSGRYVTPNHVPQWDRLANFVSAPGHNNNIVEYSGATLTFKWSGPVVELGVQPTVSFESLRTNTLYSCGAWKQFLMPGTDAGLTLVDVQIHGDLRDLCPKPRWWMPWEKAGIEKSANRTQSEVARFVTSGGGAITIV
jgi:hypothetical protein